MMRAPLPQGEQKARAVRTMFDGIARRYDLVNRIMTFGLDVRWRKRATRALGLPAGSVVLDLACGTGDFCRELARGGMRAIGFDFSFGMLAAARTNAPLVQADILSLPVRDARADGITCGFALRNVVDLKALFAELARTLRSGGRIALLEVSEPRSRFLRWGHGIYFNRIVPFIGGLLSDRAAYSYLPASVGTFPRPATFAAMISSQDFVDVTAVPMSLGIVFLYVATRA